MESGGFGLICSDEGERFLSLVNHKQRQGESERALLCKFWQGKGDSAVLSNGTRGFQKTSMSACILIQPHNFMTELLSIQGDDGLLDRFLVLSARPVFKRTAEMKEAVEQLKEFSMQSFVKLFERMLDQHMNMKIVYRLDEQAQKFYDQIVDNYSLLINDKYSSESGEFMLISISSL